MYVDKRRVAVRLAQPEHDPLDGYLCLGHLTDVPETLLDLLNSTLRVIPFLTERDGSVILLTRVNIDWVMAGERVDPALIYPAAYEVSRQEAVDLELMNGTAIDGLIQLHLHEGRERTSDFLNGPADFYPVVTRLGTLLVNKARVRETRLSTMTPNRTPTDQSAARRA